MELTARLIRRITADDPVDPVDPGGTMLVDEGFDGGQDGEFIDVGGISSDSIGGTLGATLSHSSQWQVEGGYSLKILGVDEEWARWEHASHTDHFASWYYQHDVVPAANAYFYYLYAADGTTVALRVGITSAGLVYLQDSTTGTGAADDLSPALTIGSYYRFDLTAGHGSATLSIYDLAAINEVGTSLDWATLSITLTATDFSDEVVGLLVTLSAGGAAIPGNLTSESFDASTNGTQATNSTTTASSHSGSGTLTHSTTYAADGTLGLRVFGLANDILRWTHTSHVDHFVSFYFRYKTPPGGTTNAYPLQVRTGDNLTVAFQMGVQTDGKLRIRDTNTGTGGALATAASALTTNTNYRVDISALGAGGLTLRYYTGATISSTNTADAVATLTCTLTATNFSDDQLGHINTTTTTNVEYFIDRFKTDSTALPSPLGVSAAADFGAHIDRFKSDSGSMPAPLSIVDNPPPPPVSGLLVPETGAWWGASTPVTHGSGTSEAGLAEYMTATNNVRPHILHFYLASWNGTFNAAQNRMLNPGGGAARAIPLVNWKPGSVAAIPSGSANSVLDTTFSGMTTYGHRMFVTVWHEYENNFPGGPSPTQAAQYVDMFRYVVQRYRDRVPQSQRNVIWVWNVLGYSSFASDYDALYPGDDVVDWICWDPYCHAGDTEWSDIMAEGPGVWDGFYDWATTAQTLPASGSRPAGFSGAKPLMLTEFGVDLNNSGASGGRDAGNGKSDANAAAFFDKIAPAMPDYQSLKAIIYWNGYKVPALPDAIKDYQIQKTGYTATRTAVRALVDDDYFQQDTSVAD